MHHVTIGWNIGARGAAPAAPKIRNRGFIGIGAKIIGGVTVMDDATIGAQAMVVENMPAGARAWKSKAQIVPASDP